MPYPTHRRLFGLLLGALTGLAFGLVSQNINYLFMPGVPVHRPPFGPVWNILLGVLVGALLGLITAWNSVNVKGVLLGSLSAALFVAVSTFFGGTTSMEALATRVIGLLIIFVPTTALLSVALIIFRWITDREEDAYRETIHWKPPARLPRIALPALYVLAAAILGLSAMYNDLARAVTPRMMQLIEAAQMAQSAEQLPEALRVERVRYAFENVGAAFTLQWDKDDRNQFAIARPNTSPFDQSTVIARFENGYILACMYPSKTHEPRCVDFPPEQQP